MGQNNTFSKQERLCGTRQVDRLFSEGNRQISAFPIRTVWLPVDDAEGVRVLISVPKRHFHHAVDRNRIKRQIREYYRKSSHRLKEAVAASDKGLDLAFLFTDNKLWETEALCNRMDSVMGRLTDTLQRMGEKPDRDSLG